MFSTPATFTVSSFVTPSPDENTFIVNVLPSARGRAGRITCSWLSSIVPGATVVSTSTVFGVPSRCGVTARPLTRPFAYVRCTSAGCMPAVPVCSTCNGANVAGSSTTVVRCCRNGPRTVCSANTSESAVRRSDVTCDPMTLPCTRAWKLSLRLKNWLASRMSGPALGWRSSGLSDLPSTSARRTGAIAASLSYNFSASPTTTMVSALRR